MGIRQQQLPAGPDAIWRAIKTLQRAVDEGASRLLTVMRRTDQSVAATIDTSWAWLDRAGATVVTEDPVAGSGLGRPYIPMVPAPARYTDWLASTSATYEDVWRFTLKKQQAYAYISLGHTTDVSGTTGNLQLVVGGSIVGSATAVTFTQAAVTYGPFPLPGQLLDQVEIRVQAVRTAGTGAVRVGVLAASQIQA